MGGTAWFFRFQGTEGLCWFVIATDMDSQGATGKPPFVQCALPSKDAAPIIDRFSGKSGPAKGASIDGLGAYARPDGLPTDVEPPELLPGQSVTVSHMTCEVPSATMLHCSAQTGEFLWQDATLTFPRDEPSPYKASGAGQRCGGVPDDPLADTVIITAGKLSCEAATAIVAKYLSTPVDADHGNTNAQEFDGWQCMTPTAALSQESGVAVECSTESIRIYVPSDG